jgi:hypothetical protein
MATSMTCEECNLASRQIAQNIRVGGRAERGIELNFVNVGEALHGI